MFVCNICLALSSKEQKELRVAESEVGAAAGWAGLSSLHTKCQPDSASESAVTVLAQR